jgi:hypothetical protein
MEHTIAENRDIIVRYTLPTKYDKSPKGSICRVMKDNAKYTLYVQVAQDGSEHCDWITMGDFLESAFENYLENRPFIEACLWSLDGKNSRDKDDYIYGIAKVLERSLEK